MSDINMDISQMEKDIDAADKKAERDAIPIIDVTSKKFSSEAKAIEEDYQSIRTPQRATIENQQNVGKRMIGLKKMYGEEIARLRADPTPANLKAIEAINKMQGELDAKIAVIKLNVEIPESS